MILPMTKVRVLGPRDVLPRVLVVLQDFGRLHVTPPREVPGLRLLHLVPEEERRRRRMGRIRRAVRAALAELDVGRQLRPRAEELPDRRGQVEWVRAARTVRREARHLRRRMRDLEEERAVLDRYRPFLGTFREMAAASARWPDVAAYNLILPRGDRRSYDLLREGLEELLGREFELWSRELESGERGALVLVPRAAEERIEALLATTRVQEVALPGQSEGLTAEEAIRRLVARLDDLPEAVDAVRAELRELSARHGPWLAGADQALHDELERIGVVDRAAATEHAFVLEGWLPESELASLEQALTKELGSTVVVEEVSREEWVGERVPVVLHNPRLFRPFETLVRILPLPRYGTIDPTPFLAVFFPMFFGLVLGDMGYGALLGVLALLLARGSEEGSTRRSLAQIAGACSAFTVVFGALYGELLGDAGARLLGLHALAFPREEALLPFLGFALALGVVHTVLGLTLDLITKAREGGKAAVGPGVTLLMVLLVVLAFLAAVGALPRSFFTPVVLSVLALFPVLIAVEGMLGPTELLSTLGHILSYARVMAVGTASIMMAVAANRMIGAFGSVVVGSLFALLFHLVNFALGVFSPTVHSLRLHFVEFFGTFYSPGGMRYEPFAHRSYETASKTLED
jgi:V/A-type H+-transporting ATPase subunit I